MERASVSYLFDGWWWIVFFFLFLVAGADSLLSHSYFFAQFSLHTADVDLSSWNSTYMLS